MYRITAGSVKRKSEEGVPGGENPPRPSGLIRISFFYSDPVCVSNFLSIGNI